MLVLSRRRALTGFARYGVNLVLCVVALRSLGTTCADAYFLVAPLFGCTATRRRIVAHALARNARSSHGHDFDWDGPALHSHPLRRKPITHVHRRFRTSIIGITIDHGAPHKLCAHKVLHCCSMSARARVKRAPIGLWYNTLRLRVRLTPLTRRRVVVAIFTTCCS